MQVIKLGSPGSSMTTEGGCCLRSPVLVLEFHPFKMILRALSSSWLRGFKLKPFSSGLPGGENNPSASWASCYPTSCWPWSQAQERGLCCIQAAKHLALRSNREGPQILQCTDKAHESPRTCRVTTTAQKPTDFCQPCDQSGVVRFTQKFSSALDHLTEALCVPSELSWFLYHALGYNVRYPRPFPLWLEKDL